MKNKIFNINPDRSKYPTIGKDGKPEIDLSSGKFVKIWQGPNHPGVTGNMSLELTVSGDEIVDAKTHVGYLHRGFEKLFERRKYIQCFPTCIRMCVPEADSNEYCLAAGTEKLSGIEAPDRAKWLRMLALEMARLQMLLRTVPGQGGTMGLGIGVQWGMYLRDLILDRFEELTGGRVYHMYIIAGGVRGGLPDGFEARLEENLKKIDEFTHNIDNVLYQNAVFRKRAMGVGYLDPSWVNEYGVVGPNARAAGFKRDVRKDNPYLFYDQLDWDVPIKTESDIYARTRIRWYDLQVTVDLIRQILAKIPKTGDIRAKTPNVLNWKIPEGQTYVKSESSRGEFGFFMVSDGTDKPRRINLRGPSYTHAIPLLERMLINTNIADVGALMVSLQTCPPEIER
ncbi:MAG: NADH-quinone oxidoreductase subunit D [Bacteroidota bacterium]|nr:NADH-quinone oxidoreductase subunit D [Bacteroidota bacterium]